MFSDLWSVVSIGNFCTYSNYLMPAKMQHSPNSSHNAPRTQHKPKQNSVKVVYDSTCCKHQEKKIRQQWQCVFVKTKPSCKQPQFNKWCIII